MKQIICTIVLCALVLKGDMHEEVFCARYAQATWGRNAQGEGHSGWGSTPDVCAEYMSFVQRFMQDAHITSVVDAGCGDWQFSRLMDWKGVSYIGYDVVGHLISRNNEQFAAPNISFVHANFLATDLPSADLFLCKDVFQHLTNQDIIDFIPQLKKFKYCLITNEVDAWSLTSDNNDTQVGEFHRLDLSKPPFNLKGYAVLNYRVWNEVHQVFLIDNTIPA